MSPEQFVELISQIKGLGFVILIGCGIIALAIITK